jgi:hypothetical protein
VPSTVRTVTQPARTTRSRCGGSAYAVTREQVVASLRPLLEFPVEHVLATHGGPKDRAALARALAA